MTTHTAQPVTPSLVTATPRHVRPSEPQPLRWTRDEYYRLAREGFFEGKRVLLLDGEIIEMPGQGNWHSVVLGLVEYALNAVFPPTAFWIRTQCPLDLPDGSEPEPDAAVVPGEPLDYTAHPTTALLVVEVADSSLRLDRKKANAYASAGVQDYWIVDIVGHQVEVYREPTADAREPFGHKYQRTDTLRPGNSIAPIAAPRATVAIGDLLPKQPVPNPGS
jgi:Uma2 family endonuclease